MRDWRPTIYAGRPPGNLSVMRSPHCRAGRRTSRRPIASVGRKPRRPALEPTNSVSSITFASLGLAEPLLRALDRERFIQPTPIQASAVPPLLAGRDLLGIAQ